VATDESRVATVDNFFFTGKAVVARAIIISVSINKPLFMSPFFVSSERTG
jgi:hypothetical protein